MKIKMAATIVALLLQSFISNTLSSADMKTKVLAKSHQETLDPGPFLLTSAHPLYNFLTATFSDPNVLKNSRTFDEAGFETLFLREHSNFLRVARHPAAPGYLFKLYLNKESDISFREQQEGLIRRAVIANKVQNIINHYHIQHIDVAKKWLFALPASLRGYKTVYILVVEDMNLLSREQSKKAWRSKGTKRVLVELYRILRAGYTSLSIDQNIPRSKSGKFSCIDTEYAKRKFDLKRINRFLSKKNQKKWNKIRKHH